MKTTGKSNPASISHHDAVVEELRADPEFAAEYLRAAMEESVNDPPALRLALRRLALAYGFRHVAHKTGMSRTSLYKSLSPGGNPTLQTVSAILAAMGMRLSAEPLARRNNAQA
ncbi:MAG: addiction module antidote protein [Acidobacteriota bacterium]